MTGKARVLALSVVLTTTFLVANLSRALPILADPTASPSPSPSPTVTGPPLTIHPIAAPVPAPAPVPTSVAPPPAPTPPPLTIHPIPAASVTPAVSPAATGTAGYWEIHPRNVPDQCLQFLVEQSGTNDTGGPTYVTNARVAACDAPLSTLHIANADGSPWGGADGDVIIASEYNVGSFVIGCLENPLRMPTPAPTSPIGSDGIDAQWYPCATGGGTDPQAQRFYINTGASGATGPFSIDSSLEYALGYPNPKLESLNEYDPNHIRFEPYSGLHNWYATPASAP